MIRDWGLGRDFHVWLCQNSSVIDCLENGELLIGMNLTANPKSIGVHLCTLREAACASTFNSSPHCGQLPMRGCLENRCRKSQPPTPSTLFLADSWWCDCSILFWCQHRFLNIQRFGKQAIFIKVICNSLLFLD